MRTGLLLTVTDVLTSWGHHALKSLNPSLHYILARLLFCQSTDNFWIYGQNPFVLPFKWNLFCGVHTESWILEKVLKFVQQFSRPGKSLENEMKSTKIEFFFSKLQQMLYKWIFFTFVKSYSISSICLQHTMKKALFLHYKIGDQ